MINQVITNDQATQQQLETWYTNDGRHDPTHPQHATYTGLAMKYANRQEDSTNNPTAP